MVDQNQVISAIPHSRHHRKSIRQILFAAIIFASGMVIGAGGMVKFFQYRTFRPPDTPKKMAAEVTREIQNQLGLSDIQAGQVEVIFTKEFQTMDTIRNEFEARMDTQRKSLITEMEMVLTPGQFAQWRDEFQSRQRRMRGPFPPGPPPDDSGLRPGEGPRPDGPPPNSGPRPGSDKSRPGKNPPPEPW